MSQSPKTTPKDFVLWLGAMITLYVSAGSLITLLFSYIDILFQDPLESMYYYDPYSGAIRFAMASLIILVPVFIGLTRYINQDIRNNPEKKTIGIRKWLIYITLLAAGAFIVGDLIALVNGFLGGELTTRFFLKVLTILVVAGSVFMYYFADIKGKWEKEEKTSKMIGMLVGVLVLGSIIAGFFLMGSPAVQRELHFDQERVNDLQSLQWQIVDFWQSKEQLPATLEELEDSITGFRVPTDPATDQPYMYNVTGDMTFDLCATFNQPTPERGRRAIDRFPTSGIVDENWEHEAGEVCFDRTIDPDRFPPREKPVPVL